MAYVHQFFVEELPARKWETPGWQRFVSDQLCSRDYPGIIYTGNEEDHVSGVLCDGLSSPHDIWRLDAFEGDEYERRTVKAMVVSGPEDPEASEVDCQAYIWIESDAELKDHDWEIEKFIQMKQATWLCDSKEFSMSFESHPLALFRQDNYRVVPSASPSDFEQEPLIATESHSELETDPEHEHHEEEEEHIPAPHPAIVFVFNGIKTILTPILRVLFAPKAQRTIIKSVAVCIALTWVLLTSVAAYLAFYRQYVPQTAHIEPIYFQYDRLAEGPTDIVDFTQGQLLPQPLRHEQAYDISVRLHVPTSDINFDLGNFMVKIWLQTEDGSLIANSSRPAILRYQSKTQRIMRVLAKALPLLVGLSEESQVITVPLIEGHMEHKARPVTQATISLSSNRLQIYDAEIHVIADFHGLRYYMYHRRLITAIGFIAMFIGIEVICAAVAWKFFGQNMWNKLHDALGQMENTTEDAVVAAEDTQPTGDDENAPPPEGKVIDDM
ncbi:putative adipose-regulatory protein-domain-containing protein [Dichotomocladium elegans]|nr:putative adipose-regulatory protein-domain-containing protein [Dichotomocladium elegans]